MVPDFSRFKKQLEASMKSITTQSKMLSGSENSHPFSELVIPASIMQDVGTATKY
jgi:hypothetical protein